jgi:hydroxymethylbilane synthase
MTMTALHTVRLVIGTRTSPLALWQTNHILERLRTAWPALVGEIQHIITQGDKTQQQNKALPEIGGKGLFTAELETALRAGEIDIAIHSLKDLPVEDAPSLTLGAITSRADVHDGLVARNNWTLATLPRGALVGTSSTRRAAQLLAARPDLTIQSIRGNVETRIRKVQAGDYAATVLAGAGLQRLGLTHLVTEWLPLEIMLPAPGQGALAVQCRADDQRVLALLSAIDDPAVRLAVTAERAFLHSLGGGCSAPVAAYAEPLAERAHLQMTGLIALPDGQRVVRVQGSGPASELGAELARQALARGAAHLLTPGASIPARLQPLAGKRIVLTRSREQAGEWAAKLSELGASPVLIPTIRTVARTDLHLLDEALGHLADYQWLIFTSGNGVRVVQARLAANQWGPERLQQCHIAAVGSATAAALQPFGVATTALPDEFMAEAIATKLGNLTGQRVLLPQAAAARSTLAEQLRRQGAQVDVLAVYDTLPVELDAVALNELRQGVDAIVFTSGSTVHNLVAGLQDDPSAAQQLRQALLICIGPATAEVVRQLGLPVGVVAVEPSLAGVVTALCEYYHTLYYQSEHPA